jgi:aminopeptidase N
MAMPKMSSIVIFLSIFLSLQWSFTAVANQTPQHRPLCELLERLPRPQDKEMLRSAKARLEPTFRQEKSDTRHSYDVRHYEINMDIDIPGDSVHSAVVFIDGASETDTLTTADLDFIGMTIDSMTVDGALATYLWESDRLLVHLGSAISQGDSFQVAVYYHGRPATSGGNGLFIDSDVTYTMCEPEGARRWFPCYDRPSDKATADISITVPEGYIVASNGLLIATAKDETAETITYSWSETYPIATYLISLAISEYATFSYWYHDDGDTMEIACYVPREDSAAAAVDFANLPDMIACYSGLFGTYPFVGEKYGMATFPWGGAMEHQTCTSWGFPLPGNNYYDWVVAHELSHQWWGDWVSPDNWKEIWLNEGFATYSEALWMEHLYGGAGLRAYMAEMQDYYVGWENSSGHSFPIYDPPPGYLFSSTEYDKAGCVLHMLRFVVGDSTFFDILKAYGAAHAYGNAVTEDFQGVCEDLSGQDLDWFFDQWIYQPGFPKISFAWNYELQRGTGYLVNVSLVQQQQSGPIFEMPVEIGITTASGTVLDTVLIDEEAEQIQLALEEEPLGVQLDPNEWLLCEKEEVHVTEPILVMDQYTIDDADGDGWVSPGETADLIVSLENQGTTACGITGILRTDDDEVIIADSTANFEEIRFYQSGDNTLTPFVFSVPAESSPHWADFTLQLFAAGDYQETIAFRLPIGVPTVLLVDDDGGGDEEIFYTGILDSLNVLYEIVDMDKAGGVKKLQFFDVLIWFTGRETSNTLSSADQDSLAAYLDAGGNLLMAGSGLGNDIGATAFYDHYLHTVWNGETSSTLLQGVSGDPISSGQLMVILNQDGEQDQLDAAEDAGTSVCFNYIGSGAAAIRHESGYKTLYFGYSLEYTRSDNPSAMTPYKLMSGILNWFGGVTPVASGGEPAAGLPERFELDQNYPNPFNASTRIAFRLPQAAPVELQIFNVAGQQVRTLANENYQAGRHVLLWDGHDDHGQQVASGIYFCRLRAKDVRRSIKMLLLR